LLFTLRRLSYGDDPDCIALLGMDDGYNPSLYDAKRDEAFA
jgi:hypothetical protein